MMKPRLMHLSDWRKNQAESGFSLVEILAAFTILSISVTLLLLSVRSSVQQNILARKIQVATQLCRKKTEELDEKFKVDGFSDLASLGVKETKSFDPPFADYTYEVQLDQVQLGDLANAFMSFSGANSPQQKMGTDMLGQMASASGAAFSGAMGPLKSFLEKGLRRVTVRVFYSELSQKKSFVEVIFYAVDLGRLP